MHWKPTELLYTGQSLSFCGTSNLVLQRGLSLFSLFWQNLIFIFIFLIEICYTVSFAHHFNVKDCILTPSLFGSLWSPSLHFLVEILGLHLQLPVRCFCQKKRYCSLQLWSTGKSWTEQKKNIAEWEGRDERNKMREEGKWICGVFKSVCPSQCVSSYC